MKFNLYFNIINLYEKLFFTVTTDYIKNCRITQIWSCISVFIEEYEGSDVLIYAQRCLEQKALALGANGIVGFKLTSSSTYNNEERLTPEVFAYGTPVLWENKTCPAKKSVNQFKTF